MLPESATKILPKTIKILQRYAYQKGFRDMPTKNVLSYAYQKFFKSALEECCFIKVFQKSAPKILSNTRKMIQRCAYQKCFRDYAYQKLCFKGFSEKCSQNASKDQKNTSEVCLPKSFQSYDYQKCFKSASEDCFRKVLLKCLNILSFFKNTSKDMKYASEVC